MNNLLMKVRFSEFGTSGSAALTRTTIYVFSKILKVGIIDSKIKYLDSIHKRTCIFFCLESTQKWWENVAKHWKIYDYKTCLWLELYGFTGTFS